MPEKNADAIGCIFLAPTTTSLHAGVATGPGEWWNDGLEWSWPYLQDLLQSPKPSTAKLRRLQAVLLSLRPSPLLDLVSSHRQPDIGEQLIVARSVDTGTGKLFVPGILQPDPHVEPRPPRREAAYERNVGDFRNPAPGIRTQIRRTGEEERIWAAPAAEILSGEHDRLLLPYAKDA